MFNMLRSQLLTNINPTVVKEWLVFTLLQSMEQDKIHPNVLREVADIVERLLSIIFEKF